MAANENKDALEILLQTLKENPELWETRRKTAKLLYADKQYLEAADILWNAPEIPSTDVDVAFVLKIISRVKPNRSIRLIYEVIRRNKDKPQKSMAVARALNDIGMYMEASRFYGAALASDTSLFDLGFERQMLWLDDSTRLIEEWRKSDQDSKPPLDVPQQQITGGMITPNTMPENIADKALSGAPLPPPSPAPGSVKPAPGAPSSPATRPLMVAGGSPPPNSIAAAPSTAGPKNPLLRPGAAATQPLAVGAAAAPRTNALLAPGAGNASSQLLHQPLSPSTTQPMQPPQQQQPQHPQNASSRPATRPAATPLVSPGMGARSDSQQLSQPSTSSQRLLPQRPPSMLSSPPVPTQPLAMAPPTAMPMGRPLSQPIAYTPVSTQPLTRASQPIAYPQQVPQVPGYAVPQPASTQPIAYAPSATQPIGYVQTPQGLMPIQAMPAQPMQHQQQQADGQPQTPQFKLQ